MTVMIVVEVGDKGQREMRGHTTHHEATNIITPQTDLPSSIIRRADKALVLLTTSYRLKGIHYTIKPVAITAQSTISFPCY